MKLTERQLAEFEAEGYLFLPETFSAAEIGVRGRLDLTITGLDEMIAAASGAARSGQVAPGVQGNMMFLMLLKGMAKRTPGPDGGTVDRLEIVVTPAGDILLNGLPFSMAPQQ